jgi:tetratricopeptide (TPR) repeat protein
MEDDGVDNEVKIQIGITYNEIGLILMKTKKLDGALNVFNEALKYIPADYGVHVNRGDVYRDMGNINLALSDYHYAIDLGAPQASVQHRLAIVHYMQGIQCFNMRDYNGALIEFSRAIEANPCPEYYKKRIMCNEQLRKVSEMITDLRMLSTIDKADQWAKAYLQKLV